MGKVRELMGVMAHPDGPCGGSRSDLGSLHRLGCGLPLLLGKGVQVVALQQGHSHALHGHGHGHALPPTPTC